MNNNSIWKPIKPSAVKQQLYNIDLEPYYHLIDYGELTEEIKKVYPNGGDNFDKSIVRAYIIGKSKTLLKKRLIEGKIIISKEIKQYFKTVKFDFENKRLIGSNGYYLQWSIGTTSTGGVSCRKF